MPVRVKSYTYEVTIGDITENGYTLKLNQAELPRHSSRLVPLDPLDLILKNDQ